MAIYLLFVFLTVAGLAAGCNFNFVNNMDVTVWVGMQASSSLAVPPSAGFAVAAGGAATIPVLPGWIGIVWGRTECNFDVTGNGFCKTGDCNSGLVCNGGPPAYPATVVVFQIGPAGVTDNYFVSLVYGFNVPIQVKPTVPAVGSYCQTSGCVYDLNLNCPASLSVSDSGSVIACKSDCVAYNTDATCCTGNYANSNSCQPGPSAEYFKEYCTNVRSYPYDTAGNYTCTNADYNIFFGSIQV